MLEPAAWPRVGVGGVVIRAGRALIVRRAKPPLRGRWTVPGGTLELGETLEDALRREMREETGLEVRPLRLIGAFDRIERRGTEVPYHYVILDYLCEHVSGTPRAGSDAEEIALVAPDELAAFDLPRESRQVILDAFGMAGAVASAGREE